MTMSTDQTTTTTSQEPAGDAAAPPAAPTITIAPAAPGTHQDDGQQTDPAPADDEHDDQDQDGDEDTTDPAKREAIKYRRRLRETEAERDALAERVAGLTRTIVSDVVAGQISPEAFFLAGHEPADFMNDDGTVRRDELDAAVSEVSRRLELRSRDHPGDPGQGARGHTPEAPKLSDAFRTVR